MTEAITGEVTKEGLKRIAEAIVLRQGNQYIKELLREHNVKIGATKADFLANLGAAIDEDILTREIIDNWLLEVEGWGKEHVYLFKPPAIAAAAIAATIRASLHAALIDTPVSYDFPEELILSSIALSDARLSLVWHCGNVAWQRTPEKDYDEREEDGEHYLYKAYRERFDRSVVRFEWQFADPFCAVMIQLPHEGSVHTDARTRVIEDLVELGLVTRDLSPVLLSQSVKASGRAKNIVIGETKFETQGGYIDFVATHAGGIAGVGPLSRVRKAVDVRLFPSANAMFNFLKKDHPTLSRPIKLQVFGREGRIRLWVQCKREDVYLILDSLWAMN